MKLQVADRMKDYEEGIFQILNERKEAVEKKGKKVYVQAGAGIVADSVPENEYQECANKAGAVIEATRLAEEMV